MENQKIINEIEFRNSHLSSDLKALKYEKMLASPFTFFRATNNLFWLEYSNHPKLENFGSDIDCWLQGDCHVYNFGIFHNKDKEIVYDLNDFDETVMANYQFDLWRFASSLLLACKSETELSEKKRNKIIELFSESYLKEMHSIIEGQTNNKDFLSEEGASGILEDELKRVKKKENRKKMLNKWTNNVNGIRKFDFSLDKLKRLSRSQYSEIEESLTNYFKTLDIYELKGEDHFKIKDIVQRLYSGLGSFGVARYYVLIEGDKDKVDDDILLDVKWQSKPTAYHFLSEEFRKAYDLTFENEGIRYTIAYNAMLKKKDPYSGYLRMQTGDYAIREISPYKSYIPIESLTKKKHYLQMVKHWAKIIAMYHSINMEDSSKIKFKELTKGREEEFSQQLLEIATDFADKTEQNWKIFNTFVESK